MNNNDNSTEETVASTSSFKFTKIYVIELILAIIAIGVLAYAIIRSGNKVNSSDDSTSSNNEIVSANDLADSIIPSDQEPIEIDNSILFSDIPTIPNVDAYNNLSLSDCETASSEGTMLKLTADGIDIYINNYENKDLLLANTNYTQEEIDDAIFSQIISNFGETGDCDHDIAQSGDTVNISYVGKIDGVAFDGGTATDDLLLGSGSYIPGFEDGVIGMKVGETKDISVTFPEDYFSKELAGKTAVFTITLNELVSSTVYPELTDEMVQMLVPGVSSIAECNDYFKKVVIKEKIWTFLAKDFYISELDSATTSEYYTTTMKYYDTMSKSYQAPLSDLIAQNGQTIDDFKIEVMDNSAHSSCYHTFYEALMNYNQLSLDDSKYAEFASAYGYDDVQLFLEDYGKLSVDDYLYQEEILDYIADLRLELE